MATAYKYSNCCFKQYLINEHECEKVFDYVHDNPDDKETNSSEDEAPECRETKKIGMKSKKNRSSPNDENGEYSGVDVCEVDNEGQRAQETTTQHGYIELTCADEFIQNEGNMTGAGKMTSGVDTIINEDEANGGEETVRYRYVVR